jgi:CRISPR/Cas system-associated protein Cas10 (large subunit of type III CRISPR-Cas system)
MNDEFYFESEKGWFKCLICKFLFRLNFDSEEICHQICSYRRFHMAQESDRLSDLPLQYEHDWSAQCYGKNAQ